MKFYQAALLAASLAFAPTSGSLAAEAMQPMASMDTALPLPAICLTASGNSTRLPKMDPMTGADEAHIALMAGMNAMDQNMMAGSTAKDIDVAFVCSMIPHHQGAISMARAVLNYGKSPFTRKLATGIIAAQEQEIAEMTNWLATRK